MTLRRIHGAILAVMLLALTACAIPPELAAIAEPEPYVDPPVASDPHLAALADDVVRKSWSSTSGELRQTSCWEIENVPTLHDRGFRRGFREAEGATGGGAAAATDQELDAIVAAWVAHLRRVC